MTMHNHAEVGEISERIVLVGDPNRAKYIAEHYLEDAVLVNDVRCAYCYTGMFEGVRVSVMAVGMGGPSMLIYATELCRDYGCKILVRAGTSGGYQDDMKNFDIVLSQAVQRNQRQHVQRTFLTGGRFRAFEHRETHCG